MLTLSLASGSGAVERVEPVRHEGGEFFFAWMNRNQTAITLTKQLRSAHPEFKEILVVA